MNLKHLTTAALAWAQIGFRSFGAELSRRLPMLPPAREATLWSERSDSPTAIFFADRSGSELHLFRLNFEAQRQPTISTLCTL